MAYDYCFPKNEPNGDYAPVLMSRNLSLDLGARGAMQEGRY